jgi:exopolysaccharide production protein ExoQ
MQVTRLAEAVDRWLPVVVFAALPTLGLLAGPAYSSLIIGLTVVTLLRGMAAGRGLPPIDDTLAALAGAFLALCWASAAWSIVPATSLRTAMAETAILVAMLLACAKRRDPEEFADAVFPVLMGACVVGTTIACLDMALGDRLQALVSGKPGLESATKYNRGLDYLALIAWPTLGYAWWRRQWLAFVVVIAAVAIALAMGLSLAGRVAFAAGFVVLMLAGAAPRLVAAGLALCTGAFVITLPLALRLLAARRVALTPYVKSSGIQRLQIWDYMTARVLDRPIQGWGLLSAKSVPIRPDELASYVGFSGNGVYPHNQWLQLWVELGALGAAAGLAFAWLVLARIRRLPAVLRPFACAAFTSAMAVAGVNYEITTDSWWAALAATAMLFMILARQMSQESGA